VSCLGVFVAIATLAHATFDRSVLLLAGSFGSSTVILFAFQDTHYAQPRSLVGGHFISALVGVAALAALGPSWWSLGLAVAGATAAMHITRCMHPPAGSNPVVIYLAKAPWTFAFAPVLAGASAMVLVAILYFRVVRRRYPVYWW
jgi:CBS-domain-containing membrane protein